MSDIDLDKLKLIFQAIFELGSPDDASTVSQDQVDNWDSLRHVHLIIAIENEFSVDIDPVDSMELTSFDSIRAYLETV